jgi:prophage regulatory protein
LWEKVKSDPDFPKPVYLGPKSPVFIEQHLDEYIAKCAAKSAAMA